MLGHPIPSPGAARSFLNQFHSDEKLREAMEAREPDEIAYIPGENDALTGLHPTDEDLSLQRLALPVTIGSVRYAGIRIHDTRIIPLMEMLLDGGHTLGGRRAKQIHHARRWRGQIFFASWLAWRACLLRAAWAGSGTRFTTVTAISWLRWKREVDVRASTQRGSDMTDHRTMPLP